MPNTGLLIDYNNIIEPNINFLGELSQKIKPVPNNDGFILGLILIIPEDKLDSLKNMEKGKERILYLNNRGFVDDIKGYTYVKYDTKRKICEFIDEQQVYLPLILESILSNFPNNINIYVGISLNHPNFENIVKKYIKNGFQNPFICRESPTGYKYEPYGLCMIRRNDIIDKKQISVSNVKYVLEQFQNRNNNCHINVKFTNDTINYLKKISSIGSTINKDGTITQKELAGRFIARQPDSKKIFPLDIDKKSVIAGSEEGVSIKQGIFNFHTHPIEAYDRNDVKIAFPSAQDFVGFLNASKVYSTILHSVVSREGIYVISVNKYWVNKINKAMINFVRKKYVIGGRRSEDVSRYLDIVNKYIL